MRYKYSFIALLSILMGSFAAKASHIVGGEITYRCLGNDLYEISLTVFRDYVNANAGAVYDDPASIAVYSGTGYNYLGRREVPFVGEIQLDPTLNDSCWVSQPNVGVEVSTYIDTVLLTANSTGYTLRYQRCCRNNIINNIQNPEATGATYEVFISPQALQNCNNSLVFNDWPPIYICQNKPIFFDHSATDADGDSIVYEMCAPLDGATPDDPLPINPTLAQTFYSQTVAQPVVWDPPYNTQNMLGDPNSPLAIDPNTGRLTGNPINLGTYVVGICAREYRNGVLMSVVRRDFQYTIGVCGRTALAAFNDPIHPCNNTLDIPFTNFGTSSETGYLWDFGDPAGSPNTSTDANPTHTFSDTGAYFVTLIADPGTPCADTAFKEVQVNLDGIKFSVNNPEDYCINDSVQLTLNEEFVGTSNNISIIWAPQSGLLSGQGTDSVWVLANQTQTFEAFIIGDNGCRDTVQTTVDIDELDSDATFSSIDENCRLNLNVGFNNFGNANSGGFLWDFGDTASINNTSTLANPTHSYSDTGTYTVTLIADPNSRCSDTLQQTIRVELNGIDISVNQASDYCVGDTVRLFLTRNQIGYSDSLSIFWNPDGEIVEGQGSDSVWVITDANKTLDVVMQNEHGCADSAQSSINIDGLTPPLDITLMPSPYIFRGQSVVLNATNDIDYIYAWEADTTLSALDVFNPVAKPRVNTDYRLTVTNQLGCTNTDTVSITIREPICDDPTVFIPNAFTPNGDGENDILYVRGTDITDVWLIIYNRWGEKVFETNDLNQGWDGRYQGNELPPDVFGYYLECRCGNGGELKKKGNITLLR